MGSIVMVRAVLVVLALASIGCARRPTATIIRPPIGVSVSGDEWAYWLDDADARCEDPCIVGLAPGAHVIGIGARDAARPEHRMRFTAWRPGTLHVGTVSRTGTHTGGGILVTLAIAGLAVDFALGVPAFMRNEGSARLLIGLPVVLGFLLSTVAGIGGGFMLSRRTAPTLRYEPTVAPTLSATTDGFVLGAMGTF